MRILLKLSGEALQGSGAGNIDVSYVRTLAEEILSLQKSGHQIALVVGGGNIWRGASAAEGSAIERSSADFMGMLATVMNGVALWSAIESVGGIARVMSAIPMAAVAEPFVVRRGIRHMEKGRIVICVAWSGNPYFTTDSAAVLRGLELKCDVVVKATKVDGIYDKDPKKFPDARRYDRVSYDEAIAKNLRVMDQSALGLARDEKLPIVVCSIDSIAQLGGSDFPHTRVEST